MKDTAASTNLPVRLYQVRLQPLPPGNSSPVTSTTVTELEKVLGLTFTASQRSALVGALGSSRSSYESMRKVRLLNSDSPPLIFDPIAPGVRLDTEEKPITWSTFPEVTKPNNLAEVAFYSVGALGELIRSRQLTSTELTQLYLERLRKYQGVLRCGITFTDELALRQAAQADAEIAVGRYRGPLHGIPYGLKDLFWFAVTARRGVRHPSRTR